MAALGFTGCAGTTTEEMLRRYWVCALEDEFANIESSEASLNDARDAVDQLREVAPDEIREDVDIVADAFTDFLDAVEDAGVDADAPITEVPKQTKEFQAARERMLSEEVTEAIDRVDAFIDENCQ